MNDYPKRRRASISLLCINDVYTFDSIDGHGGWSRISTLIRHLRDQAKDNNVPSRVIVTANGDLLGGSSLLVHSKGKLGIDALEAIGIDAAVLGNHEFDYGEEILRQHLSSSSFPWYGSNVYDEQTNSLLDGVTNKSILSIPDPNQSSSVLKVGIFGLTTTSTPQLSHPGPNISFQNVIETAKKITNELKSKDNVHVIIALTHLHTHQDEELAKAVPDIDVILGGHDHDPISLMSLNKTLVFKCGQNGYWVGEVLLDVEYDVNYDEGKEEIVKKDSIQIYHSWSMHSTRRIQNDPMIDDIVSKYRTIANEEIKQKFKDNEGDEPLLQGLELDDVIAKIVNDNNAISPPLDTRTAEVRRRETTSGNLIADAMLSYYFNFLDSTDDNTSFCKTSFAGKNGETTSKIDVLAMINGGFIRGDRLYNTTTNLTVKDVLEELPFPRTCTVLDIQDTHLLDGMEQQLSSLPTASGAFPHVSKNVRMVYDPNAKVGSRIVTMSVNGSLVRRGQEKMYRIILTDFVASGGDGCSAWCYGVTPKDIMMTGDSMGVADAGAKKDVYDDSNTEATQGNDVCGNNHISKFLRRKISTVVIGYLCSRREVTLKLHGRIATST